jgi:simple sugar transport system ATP-binding protein
MPLRGRIEVARPLGFIPEDRSTEGLIPQLSLAENLVLSRESSAAFQRHGRIRWRVVRERTAALLRDFGVTAAGPDAKAATLSGGNQQKLVLARELSHNPQVIVAENPTRGLDVSAAAAIHARLRDAAGRGAAVLFHANDLDEVLSLADRIVVLTGGNLRPVPSGASRADVGNLMLGTERPA